MYDVAVIGGGPVGSRLAEKLAGTGHSVVVVEQKDRLGEPVYCTGIISQECARSFAIDEGVILRRVNSATVFSPSGKRLNLWRPEPQACIVDRPALNVALARRAQDRGVEYALGSPARKVEVGRDRVRMEIGGRGLTFLEAKAVAVATGFGSRLTASLGLGEAGDFVVGAQAEVETTGVGEVEVYFGQEVAPGFFGWLVPVSAGRALVGLFSRRNPGAYLRKLVASLAAQGKLVSAEVKPNYRGIPLRPLTVTHSDRLVVVGSAAGQVKPTSGGGIYYGLLCADIAAGVLHRALQSDDLSARRLASYQKAWRKKLGREIRIGYWARRFYELLSDGQIDRIFDIIRSNGIDQALLEADDLSFDWHGGAILKLIGHQALFRALEAMKLPVSLIGRGKLSRRWSRDDR